MTLKSSPLIGWQIVDVMKHFGLTVAAVIVVV
jgi:hypothetical protein